MGVDALAFPEGPYPTMYTTQPWTIRQYAGFSTAEESKRLLPPQPRGRARSLSSPSTWPPTAATTPTTRGLRRRRHGGRGDRLALRHARTLFDGIPLDEMSVSMTMNGAVLPVLALYIVAAEEQGVPPSSSPGPSRTTSSKSSWSATPTSTRPKPSMRIISDIFAYTAERMPKFNSISISGYHMREAGATRRPRAGLHPADGVEYIRAGINRGLDIDSSRRACRSSGRSA